jgi:hypothetical protein
MRATEFIRNILDMIDAMDQPKVTVIDVENTEDDKPYDDEQRREEQIKDLEDDEDKFWANQPAERVADISAVTTGAGGGVNGPKHPADIRTAHGSMYPNFQAKD